MTAGDVFILVFIGAAFVLSVVSIVRQRKRGGCCGDCSRCQYACEKVKESKPKTK